MAKKMMIVMAVMLNIMVITTMMIYNFNCIKIKKMIASDSEDNKGDK